MLLERGLVPLGSCPAFQSGTSSSPERRPTETPALLLGRPMATRHYGRQLGGNRALTNIGY